MHLTSSSCRPPASPKILRSNGLSLERLSAFVGQSDHTTGGSLTSASPGPLRAFPVAELTDREKQMLRLRFGLSGNGERSIREIAAMHRLSPERVRVLVNKALWKVARCVHALADVTSYPRPVGEGLLTSASAMRPALLGRN